MGDVIEWQKCMILVLSTPRYDGGEQATVARVMYIWKPEDSFIGVDLFMMVPSFQVAGKELWSKPLSDEMQALVMQMLLIHGG